MKTSYHQPIRTLVVAVISLSLYHIFHHSEAYWLPIAAIFILQIRNGDLFRQQLLLATLGGILSACVAFLTNLIGNDIFLVASLLFVTSFMVVFLSWTFSEIFLGLYMVNLFAMLSAGIPVDFENSIARVEFILLGTSIAILAKIIFWPATGRRSAKWFFAETLDALNRLWNFLFSTLVARDYQQRIFSYEKPWHEKSEEVFSHLWKARKLLAHLPDKQLGTIYQRLEIILEIVLGISALRYRIKDTANFEMIEKELQIIQKSFSITIQNAADNIRGNNISINTDYLQKIIVLLEQSYLNILQVVVSEPIIFLFFIQQLKNLQDQLVNLQQVSNDFPINNSLAERKHFSFIEMVRSAPALAFRRALGTGCAVFLAVVMSRTLKLPQEFLVSMSSIMVMQASFGHALQQGLLRFLVLSLSVIASSIVVLYVPSVIAIDFILMAVVTMGFFGYQLQQPHHLRLTIIFMATIILTITLLVPFSPDNLIYARLYDVLMGSTLGLVSAFVFFPHRIETVFHHRVIKILNAYANYLIAINDRLLQKNTEADCEQKKIEVERALLFFPSWVYEKGFNPELRQGYRHFLVKLEQLGQLLFSMHALVRYPVDPELINPLAGSLHRVVARAKKIMTAITTVLSLEKLKVGILDFDEEIIQLEKKFHQLVPASLELLDLSKENVCLAEFIFDLKEIRRLLLTLAEALR